MLLRMPIQEVQIHRGDIMSNRLANIIFTMGSLHTNTLI